MFCRCLVFSVIAAAAAYGQNAQLSAPSQTLNPGQTVITSLSLASAGHSIAAIQFDLQWDSPLGVRITAGAGVRAASKIPYVASLDSHQLRYLIVGMNQTVFADGEILKLFLSADPSNSTQSTTQVKITNVMASDPGGMAIPVNAAPINIQFQNDTLSQWLPTDAVLNAASLVPSPLSPGEIITLFGWNGPPPVTVRIGGSPAPILYAGADQINAVVPFGLDVSSAAPVEVNGPNRKVTLTLPVAQVSPAIFSMNGSGLGPGAILNEDLSPNSFENPALPASTIMVYGTGFGMLQLPVADGQPAANANPTVMPVTATVAGLAADVTYAGAAPGLMAGVMQINVRLPSGLAHNLVAPLALHVSGIEMAQGITVAVQ